MDSFKGQMTVTAVFLGGMKLNRVIQINGIDTINAVGVSENGTPSAQYLYDAFGNTIAKSGTLVDTFNFWFSTKYLDHETSLYYYGFRFYSPELMRWLNRDPIEEQGGVNIYGFAGNNGVNIIDVLGLGSWSFQVLEKPYWEGVGVSVNVSYTLDSKEAKCCKKFIINRWVKKLFGLMGGKYGEYWFDGDMEDILAMAGNITAFAPEDNPQGPNILGYRIAWIQSFKFEAVCIQGPYAGKVLSTVEKQYKSEGHWARKDFKGGFLD